jgi:hypothetical protein
MPPALAGDLLSVLLVLHQSREYFEALGEQLFGLPLADHSLGETAPELKSLAEVTRWLAQRRR